MKIRRVAAPLLIGMVVVLSAWTLYANVLSDDTAVRARAERLARDKAGCGDKCKSVRAEGTRGMLSETISFTFDSVGRVTVTCRRPYIAFGDHVCAVSSP